MTEQQAERIITYLRLLLFVVAFQAGGVIAEAWFG